MKCTSPVLTVDTKTHVSQAHRAGLKLFHQFLNKMNCQIFYFLEIWATKSMLKGTNQSEFGSLLIQISPSVSGPKVLKKHVCDLPLLNFSENSLWLVAFKKDPKGTCNSDAQI